MLEKKNKKSDLLKLLKSLLYPSANSSNEYDTLEELELEVRSERSMLKKIFLKLNQFLKMLSIVLHFNKKSTYLRSQFCIFTELNKSHHTLW